MAKTATARTAPEKAEPARVGARRVAQELARLIEKGEYAPGQRLKEQELADRFGLSRAPIREALRLLESQGLVVIEEMRGARVVRPSEASFHELWLIRAYMSSVLAQFAAMNEDSSIAAQKQGFVDAARELAAAAKAGADVNVIYTGLRAHMRALTDISTSVRAKSLLLGLGGGREAFQVSAIQTLERRIEATANWVQLAEAVQAGNGPKAGKMMQTLYRNSMKFITENDEGAA